MGQKIGFEINAIFFGSNFLPARVSEHFNQRKLNGHLPLIHHLRLYFEPRTCSIHTIWCKSKKFSKQFYQKTGLWYQFDSFFTSKLYILFLCRCRKWYGYHLSFKTTDTYKRIQLSFRKFPLTNIIVSNLFSSSLTLSQFKSSTRRYTLDWQNRRPYGCLYW